MHLSDELIVAGCSNGIQSDFAPMAGAPSAASASSLKNIRKTKLVKIDLFDFRPSQLFGFQASICNRTPRTKAHLQKIDKRLLQ